MSTSNGMLPVTVIEFPVGRASRIVREKPLKLRQGLRERQVSMYKALSEVLRVK